MGTVKLYTTNGCTYCQRVKEFLTERDISYSEHNIEDDPDARLQMMEISRHNIVPTVVVGEEVVVGFDPRRLDRLLNLN
jgi:glutaredoxin 3